MHSQTIESHLSVVTTESIIPDKVCADGLFYERRMTIVQTTQRDTIFSFTCIGMRAPLTVGFRWPSS